MRYRNGEELKEERRKRDRERRHIQEEKREMVKRE